MHDDLHRAQTKDDRQRQPKVNVDFAQDNPERDGRQDNRKTKTDQVGPIGPVCIMRVVLFGAHSNTPVR